MMDFKEKAELKYGDLFDYTPTIYVHSKTKVKIGCNTCGNIFEQRPNDHLNGSGCPVCSRKKASNSRLGTSDWKQRCADAHPNEEYNYDESDYINADTKIKIECLKHGPFYQTPRYHYSGGRCPDCIKNKPDRRKDTNNSKSVIVDFMSVYGDLYDYSDFVYNGMDNESVIKCKKHGVFSMTPKIHMTHGCPICDEDDVAPNKRIFIKYIENISPHPVSVSHLLNGVEYDCYIEEIDTAFCFNGLRTTFENVKGKSFNIERTNQSEQFGVHLITIYEDDWLYKENIVKSRINNIINSPITKIYARGCSVKKVEYNECELFLDANHIQGNCVSKNRYGLYYKNELVSVMTFGHSRKNLSSVGVGHELLRFCNKLGYSIVGAASRLFSAFVKTETPDVVISYADRSWSSIKLGTVYDKLGFVLDKTTDPNYYYFNKVEYKRRNRYNFRKDVLVSEGYDKTKTEIEIMTSRGYDRIWDSGSVKYIWASNSGESSE